LPPEATVFYRFHPLYNHRFPTVHRSGGRSGRMTLDLGAGRTLSVPQWMLEPEAERFVLTESARIPIATLLNVIALMNGAWFAAGRVDNTRESDHEAANAVARG
jgi:hypothetical protein